MLLSSQAEGHSHRAGPVCRASGPIQIRRQEDTTRQGQPMSNVTAVHFTVVVMWISSRNSRQPVFRQVSWWLQIATFWVSSWHPPQRDLVEAAMSDRGQFVGQRVLRSSHRRFLSEKEAARDCSAWGERVNRYRSIEAATAIAGYFDIGWADSAAETRLAFRLGFRCPSEVKGSHRIRANLLWICAVVTRHWPCATCRATSQSREQTTPSVRTSGQVTFN